MMSEVFKRLYFPIQDEVQAATKPPHSFCLVSRKSPGANQPPLPHPEHHLPDGNPDCQNIFCPHFDQVHNESFIYIRHCHRHGADTKDSPYFV
jgi:hypothetical protein